MLTKKTKKKYLCLILLISVMSSIIMSSCDSSGSGYEDVYYRPSFTVTIYTIGENVTPEAEVQVETALNKLTKAKYSTAVDLRILSASEYKAVMDSKMAAYDVQLEKMREEESISASLEKSSRDQSKKDKAEGKVVETQRTTAPPETTLFIPEKITYDPAGEDQVDIFLINSPEMFLEYAMDERMVALDEELNAKAKVLREYLFPSLLLGTQYDGKTLAIPTNRTLGTGTYMLINKRLAEKYNLDISKVKDFEGLMTFLEDVKANESNVVPLNQEVDPFGIFEPIFPEHPYHAVQSMGGKSLIYTPEKAPVVAETVTTVPQTNADGNTEPTTIPPTTLPPLPTLAQTKTEPDAILLSNVYGSSTFVKMLLWNKQFREKNWLPSSAVTDNTEFAVALREGTLEDKLAWEQNDKYEYEYILYRNPRVTKEQIQESVFAIAAGTKNVARTMEILAFMNTNEEFKNIFQYGVEGINFNYDDNGQVMRLNNEYVMDTHYTGNVFLGKTLAGENPNKWSIAKQHNLNTVNSVFIRFYLDRTKVPEATITDINKISEDAYQILKSGNIPTFTIQVDEETTQESNDFELYVSQVIMKKFADELVPDFLTLLKEQTTVD